MADDPPIERLRFTPRSLIIAVAMLGVTLAALRLIASATRVIGWVLAATTIAALLYPIVARLSRHIPRAVAILVVLLTVLGSIGLVAYRIVDEVVRETHALQEAAPDVGADLENSKRFGDLATRLKLSERLPNLAQQIPQRLQGGDTAEALRSAATRGVAFLVTGVLSLFLLLHGPRLATGGLRQIRDPVRRRRIERIGLIAYQRAWKYVAGSIGMATLAGIVAFIVARSFNVPGAAPLAVWVALWDIVPIVGAFIGVMPIVLLAYTLGTPQRGILIFAILFTYAVIEAFVFQHWIEARSVRVGPFITIVAGLIGIEMYGVGGALILEVYAVLAVAVLAEVAKDRMEPVNQLTA
jgi:predicted PurR-regulated permease PerM